MMPDFLQRISEQITNFWNRFNLRQKIQIGVSVAVAIIALVILVLVLNQPNYTVYKKDISPTRMVEIQTVLDGTDITYMVTDNGTTLEVETGDYQNATLALTEIGVLDDEGMTMTELFNNSLTTTASERNVKYELFAESELGNHLESFSFVEDAIVEITIPEKTSVLMSSDLVATAGVVITTNETESPDAYESLAAFLANAVDNLETTNITIVSNYGKLLYDGKHVDGNINSVNGGVEFEYEKELLVRSNVMSYLLSGSEFDTAEVVVDLEFDYDSLETLSETVSNPTEGSTGLTTSESTYTEESNNSSSGGSPGTDTNDGTDTMISDGTDSSVSIEEANRQYAYNTETKRVEKNMPGLLTDSSTCTVNVIKYVEYDQAYLERQAEAGEGPLVDKTWEDYKIEIEQQGNQSFVVNDDVLAAVKNVSKLDNVVVTGHTVPRFIEPEPVESSVSEYLLIGVIVGMILLLGYAVYRGTEPIEIKEIEPELSVEDMLTTTKGSADLETIEFDGKSEARVQIEQFVENNPDAVALLLRNWLNEEWE